jgi:hypothetical protein
MSNISALPTVIEGKRRLARFLHAQIPEEPAAADYVNDIDDVFLAAAQAFLQVNVDNIHRLGLRRILATKMLKTSPLLQRYRAAGRITVDGLAEACDGILTPPLCHLMTRPQLMTACVINTESQANEDVNSGCVLISSNRLQEHTSHEHERLEESTATANTALTPPEEHNLLTAAQPGLMVTCSLHLFSKLQAGNRFASVARTFPTTSSQYDIVNVLVEYGIVSSREEISTMVLLFKGCVVGVEHDRSLRSHLAAAHANRVPVVIFMEDRPDGQQASREQLLIRFIGARR